MEQEKIPKGWGEDKLSQFIDDARHNTLATFVNMKEVYNPLQVIDATFRRAVECAHNTREWFSIFFLLRAHASYLGATRLSLSGQVPEAYMVLRGCIENSLYGFYMYSKPQATVLWLKRDESKELLNKFKAEFTARNAFSQLEKADQKTGAATHLLYNRAIEFGAHPNPNALLTNMRVQDIGNGSKKFDVSYLSGDSDSLRLCLKTTAQVGVCSLMIFRIIIKERFDIMGISDDLQTLSKDL